MSKILARTFPTPIRSEEARVRSASTPRPNAFRLCVAFLVFLSVVQSAAAQRVTPEKQAADLSPGEFVWMPEVAPTGPIVILVSIAEQRLRAYRNGVLIGYSTVSTGRKGHETPTGVFTVLQKDAHHVSSIYKGAKMPYMERLTWTGIALHAGNLPGYPASHGCIRLPLEFSRLLFELDPVGTTVVIADEHSGPHEAAHPGAVLSPDLDAAAGHPGSAGLAEYAWRPERSLEGPVSLLLSTADRTLYVYRNGVEIGRSAIGLSSPGSSLAEGVFTVLEGFEETESPFVPGKRDHRWMGVPHGTSATATKGEPAKLASRVSIPRPFAAKVYEILGPGSTLFITNREAAPHTRTAEDFVVMATAHEGEG
jgi:hypothetical protein